MGSLALNEVCWLDGSVALIARGVVDDDTVEQFERRLDLAIGTGSRSGRSRTTRPRDTGPRDTRPRQLVIDLTACRLDSAGLAALIRLQRRSASRPAATRLVATGVDLLRMLQIVGLSSRFGVYETLDAAHHSGCSAAQPSAGVNGAVCQQ